MINRIVTGSYCLSVSQKSHTCHITSSLLQRVLKCQPPARMQARRRRRHSPTVHSITLLLRTAHLLMVRRFSSSMSRDNVTVDSIDSIAAEVKHTPHDVVTSQPG